ncbi:ras-related protein rab-43 [Lasius niger]|uniref:Ras-related protein rab-43 n=1 Tax=Lasius niger TaxID=67767 RepID=A0A0J7KTP6_LASNI|nr:ras-related protein rab-43 [Lasius niger]
MSCRDPDNLMASPSDEEGFDYLFKIVLIGDCGTGKTCVVQRFKSGTFVERHGNTIGVDFIMKTVLIDGKRVKSLRISRFAGNKCDLEDQRKVEKVEAEALREYLPEVLHVTETSAKDNTNIDSIFFYLASELKRRHDNRQISASEYDVVKLGAGRDLSSCKGCKIF